MRRLGARLRFEKGQDAGKLEAPLVPLRPFVRQNPAIGVASDRRRTDFQDTRGLFQSQRRVQEPGEQLLARLSPARFAAPLPQHRRGLVFWVIVRIVRFAVRRIGSFRIGIPGIFTNANSVPGSSLGIGIVVFGIGSLRRGGGRASLLQKALYGFCLKFDAFVPIL